MSLQGGDLTTLATAKGYCDPLPADQVLSGLITRISRSVQTILNRPLLVPASYTEQRDGSGTAQMLVYNWPILSVSSLKVSGVTVPVAPQLDTTNSSPPPNVPFGYRFQPWNGQPPGIAQAIELVGLRYVRGHQNVVITYKAGYQVTSEPQTIPGTPYKVTPNTPFGVWATDQGVTFAATGAALQAITSGTPTTGQYLPPDPNASPTPRLDYTFAAADTGKGVLLSYGFIPAEVEQCVLELIAERAAYRKRVGVHSQSLASQEMITYDNRGLNGYVLDVLSDYVNPLPPAIGALV